MNKIVLGVDLSGPSNAKDTAMCVWDGQSLQLLRDCSDQIIFDFLQTSNSATPIYIAADAPLTYQDGGGYRDIDRALREKLNQAGFKKIGVMAPTFTKMAYLTLRGMRLKEICAQFPNVQLFETHPGAALVLRGVDYEQVTQVKTDTSCLSQVAEKVLAHFPENSEISLKSDHELMACAALLSAIRYTQQQSLWQIQSEVIGQPLFIL